MQLDSNFEQINKHLVNWQSRRQTAAFLLWIPRGLLAGLLIGVARTVTDFVYCAYLSDLAVDQAYQRKGIGKQLIDATRSHVDKHTTLILLAAPAAREYYPRIGMQQHPSCWVWSGEPDTAS